MSQLPRVGIHAQPTVTQARTMPPDTQAAQRAQDLLRILQGGGQLAGQAGMAIRQQRRETEREDRQLQSVYDGAAAGDVQAELPELRQRVERGELDFVFDEVGPDVRVEDRARQVIDEQIADDVPEPYAEGYRRRMLPQLTAALVQRQEHIQEQARGENDQRTREGIWGAESAESIREAVESTRLWRPDLNESQRLDEYVVPTLRRAANVGDRRRFEMAAEALGGRFPGMVEELERKLEAAERQEESLEAADAWEARQNEIAEQLQQSDPNFDRILEDVQGMDELTASERLTLTDRVTRRRDQHRGRIERQTVEAFREDVAGMHIDGLASERMVDRIISWRGIVPDTEIDTQLRDVRVQQANQADEQFIADETEARVSEAVELLANGDTTLGSHAIEDIELDVPSGRQGVTITGEELAEIARDRLWQAIDQRFPVDPAEAFDEQGRPTPALVDNMRAKLDVLRQNPDLRDPDITNLFEGAFRRLPEDATDADMPPALQRGFNVYRELSQTHQRVLDAHVNEQDVQFLRTARFLHENLRDMSPGNAMLLAARAMRREPTQQERGRARPSSAELDEKTRRLTTSALPFTRDVRNPEAVRAHLGARAEAYMIASGVGAEQALDQAVSDFEADFQIVNGWYVPTRGRQVADIADLDTVAETIIEHHLKRTGREDEGVGNFTINPDEQTGLWRVTFADTGIPDEDSPVFTDADLMHVHNIIEQREDHEARRRRHEQAEQSRRRRRTNAANNMRAAMRDVDQRMMDAGHQPPRFEFEPQPEPEPAIDPQIDVNAPQHLDELANFITGLPEQEREEKRRRASQRRAAAGLTFHLGMEGVQGIFDATIGRTIENQRRRRETRGRILRRRRLERQRGREALEELRQ